MLVKNNSTNIAIPQRDTRARIILPATNPYARFGAYILVILLMSFYAVDVFAKRTVKGKITDENGNPAVNVRVKAFDSDSTSSDDFMGKTMTNSSGNYEIHYAGGHWDNAPHRITTWRPDIFIRVSARVNGRCEGGEWNADANWLFLKDSSVTNNHPHRNNLTKNLRLTNYPLPPVEVETFRLGSDMWCKVNFFFHTNCFACADNNDKVQWSEYGVTGVPTSRQRCWTPPNTKCSDADWKKIRDADWRRVEPQPLPN